MAVSATFSEILTLKARKSLNFPTPPFFEAPLGENPLELCAEIWHPKTRIVGLPEGEEIMTLAFFVYHNTARDERTDGQTRRCRKDPRRAGKKSLPFSQYELMHVKQTNKILKSLKIKCRQNLVFYIQMCSSLTINSISCDKYIEDATFFNIRKTGGALKRRLCSSDCHEFLFE